jgi:hypothetical protein
MNEENVQEVELTKEAILQALAEESPKTDDVYFYTALPMSTENLAESIEFDKDEFNKGLKATSFDCGVYTALVNSGVSADNAITYIFTLKNIDMNVKLAEINAKCSVDVAKNQSIMFEKNQL